MKIAYLIFAHNNYTHLKRLVDALHDTHVVFFIHIDNTLKLPDNLPAGENVVFIRGPKVYWGGWSFTEGIINLIRTAAGYGFDYYVFLSGADYPIRPNSFLYSQLSTGGEFINVIPGFHGGKSENRLRYYYFDCFDRRNFSSIKTVFFYVLEGTMKLFFQKKSYPFQHIFVGATWWALSHDCIGYILDQLDHNEKYIKFCKTCFTADEFLFHSIIGNSSFFNKCKTHLTYSDWSSHPKPALIDENHIELFKKQTEFEGEYRTYIPFFARKFNDESEKIVELIEKELRN